MDRSRSHPQRRLHQSRGTLRAESGLRLLLSSSRQRPAVSEYCNAGAAAGAAARRGRCTESRLKAGGAAVAGVLSSLRFLLADVIGDAGTASPALSAGLPVRAAPPSTDGLRCPIN